MVQISSAGRSVGALLPLGLFLGHRFALQVFTCILILVSLSVPVSAQDKPRREYIRLGGRVIAIENPSAPAPTITTEDSQVLGPGDTMTLTVANVNPPVSITPAIGKIDSTANPLVWTYTAPVEISTVQDVTVVVSVGSMSATTAVKIGPRFTPAAVGVSNAAGSGVATVFRRGPWKPLVSDASWLTPEAVEGSVRFNYQANTTGQQRVATVKFQDDPEGVKFQVTQTSVTVSPTQFIAGSSGIVDGVGATGTINVTVPTGQTA